MRGAAGPDAGCRARPSGNRLRRPRRAIRKASALTHGVTRLPMPRAPIFSAPATPLQMWLRSRRGTARGAAASCSATFGNGPRTGSTLIRTSFATRIRNTRSRGSATTRCCAAAVMRRARRCCATPGAISTLPTGAMCSPALAVARKHDGGGVEKKTSADNPRFKALYKLLQSSRERRQQGLSLLDGIHLVAAYRDHVGFPEQVVVNQSGLANPEIQALLETLAPCDPLLLNDALFRQLSSVATPTGVIAAIKTPRPPAVAANVDACVMLEDIQDPGNLGSILRTAAAAGIRHVFLSKGSVNAWSPRVLRAGMGAHFILQIYEQCDLR